LLRLQAEGGSLLVQPSLQCRRDLERCIAGPVKKPKGGGGVGVVGESSDEFEAEEEAEDADDYMASLAQTQKQTQKQTPTQAEEEEDDEGKGKGKGKVKVKRGKDVVDSLVSAGAKGKDDKTKAGMGGGGVCMGVGMGMGIGMGMGGMGVERQRKKGFGCANPECGSAVEKGSMSMYCGAHCAMSTSSAMLTALIRYRKLLCLYGGVKGMGPGTGTGTLLGIGVEVRGVGGVVVVDPHADLAKVSAADWAAFACGGAMGELQGGLGEENAHSSGAGTGAGVGAGEGMLAHVHALLAALPPIAGPVFLRGDLAELSRHAANVIARGLAPLKSHTPSSPRNGVTGAEDDLRRVVRLVLEDLVARVLGKHLIRGAVSHAAAVALDFESELYARYGGGAGLDKGKYIKHYSMLRQNLGKAHNDQLVSDGNGRAKNPEF
jgi:hypothetical protein